jgi:hypothetical protein
MKKIFFLLTILTAGFITSCVEDNIYVGPATISDISYLPSTVTTDNPVTVTAKITDLQGVTSAKLQYNVNGGAPATADMTNALSSDSNSDTYSGIIPAQADKAVVTFTVIAVNKAGVTATSKEGSYTVGAAPVDYANLILNEIDGNSKSIELYNKGTVAIPLEGVTLIKNNGGSAWWTGVSANGKIAAGGYVVIIQSNPDDPNLSGASGISSKQNLKFELKDPAGASRGIFLRGDESNLSATISDTAPNSYQRIPNGTGEWRLAAPTNGSANASSGNNIPQN